MQVAGLGFERGSHGLVAVYGYSWMLQVFYKFLTEDWECQARCFFRMRMFPPLALAKMVFVMLLLLLLLVVLWQENNGKHGIRQGQFSSFCLDSKIARCMVCWRECCMQCSVGKPGLVLLCFWQKNQMPIASKDEVGKMSEGVLVCGLVVCGCCSRVLVLSFLTGKMQMARWVFRGCEQWPLAATCSFSLTEKWSPICC